MSKEDIVTAVDGLDYHNEEHWNNNGTVSIGHLREALDDNSVTKKDLSEAFAPGEVPVRSDFEHRDNDAPAPRARPHVAAMVEERMGPSLLEDVRALWLDHPGGRLVMHDKTGQVVRVLEPADYNE